MATRTLGSRNGIAFRLAVVHSLARSLAALVVAAAGILGAGSVHSQGLNLDVSYGVGGKAAAYAKVDVPVGTINPLRATSMPDGKILAFGIQYASSTYWLIAIRYSSDGTVDTTFGDGGRIVSTPFPSTFSPSQMPNSVAALADGRFLVAGQRSGAAVLRLLASGAPDPSFGSGGVASTGINGTGTVVIPQTDGRILVGSSNNSSPNGLSVARLTSSGQLDPSFGTGGVAGIRVGTTGVDWVVALALQPDGRVVAAGYASNGSNLDFAVARFMADGTPDTAFGPAGNGGFRTLVGSGEDQARSVALQPDGKIVTVGLTNNGSNYDVALVRYTTDGYPDTGFNGGGIATLNFSPGAFDEGAGVALQADGKILVGARTNNSFGVARYNADGSLDLTFNGSGMATQAMSTSMNAYSLALDADGKANVAGVAYTCFLGNCTYYPAISRFTTGGAADTAFNGTGYVSNVPVGPGLGYANAAAAQADGKTVVAVTAYGNPGLFRFDAAGNLDGTFGTAGRAVLASLSGEARAVLVQPDGRLLLGGYASVTGNGYDFLVARFESDGSLDATFGAGGVLTFPIAAGSLNEYLHALALQPDGKIVAAGASSAPNFAAARLTANGTLDSSFNSTGIQTFTVGASTSEARALAIQPDGAIVVAGGASGDFAVARLLADGTLDAAFNATGKVVTAIGVSAEQANAVLVQPDGRIVAAGVSVNGAAGEDFALVRYNADGSLDTAFGSTGKVVAPIGTGGTQDRLAGFVRTTDGRFVAAGSSGSDFAVARFNPDGSLDPAFGLGGKEVTNIGADATTEQGNAIALQPDGRAVVAGSVNQGVQRIALVRYNAESSPLPLSINRVAGANVPSGSTQQFTVTFSKPVTGVDAGDFTLVTTGVTGASIAGVTGADATHTVSVIVGSGNGTVRLDLFDNDTIVDASANPLGGPGAGNASFATGQSYTVAKINQTISFPNPGSKFDNDPPFEVSATATSGLPVTFQSQTPSVCTSSGADGATISPVLTVSGICAIRATQLGNADYNAASAVQQNFSINLGPRAVAVAKAGDGFGVVSSSPGGINCGGTCSAPFNYGSGVRLTATADAGSVFTGWSGDCFGTGSTCDLQATQPRSVTATFRLLRQLTVASTGNGSGTITSDPAGVNCANCSHDFLNGTVVTLTANPAPGSSFAGWTGACSGMATCIVTMSAARSVSAAFNLSNPTLTVTIPTGGGTVSGAGIACPGDCGETVTPGAVVLLTATPDAGQVFVGWSGACSGTGSCLVTLNGSQSVVASFGYELSVSVTGGGGMVQSSPAGLSCGGSCSAPFASGALVTLTPQPYTGFAFEGWSGACSGTGACVVTMDQARSVSAAFAPRTTLSVSKAGNGTGSVSSVPAGVDCGATCAAQFVPGTGVTLTATPADGSAFIGWSGACSGTGACVLSMDADRNVTALFNLGIPVLTVTVANDVGGTVAGTGISCPGDCTESHSPGSVVNLVATPSVGAVFIGWSGACTGTGACQVTMDASKAVTATFSTAYDINRDGKPDLVWRSGTGDTYVWYMNGPTLVADAYLGNVDPSWKIDGVADFDRDGKADLVWRNGDGNTFVWYMDGPVLLSDAFLFGLPPEWVIQGVADFNGDGKPDFLMRNSVSGNAFVWFFDNATATGDQFLFSIDPSWKVEAVADLNGDGQPDLLFRNTASGLAFAWFTQYAGGALSLAGSSPSIFSIDPAWQVVQVVDWNGDGKPDLVFRNAVTGVVFVWYLDGVALGGSDFIIQIDPSWEIVPHR